MLKLTLKSGEIVTGESNYCTVQIVEIRELLTTAKVRSFRTIQRAQIEKIERVKRSDLSMPRVTVEEANAEVAAMVADSDMI